MNISSEQPLPCATAVWQELKTQAGLDLELYDRPLLEELSQTLSVDPNNFESELKGKRVSVESLISAVLSAVAPFGKMMGNILTFFSNAGASASSKDLKIRFDFDQAAESFEFDLYQLREWERQLTEVQSRFVVDELDAFQAQILKHAFRVLGLTYELKDATLHPLPLTSVAVTRWLETSANTTLPGPPRVTDAQLSALLARVWRYLQYEQVKGNVFSTEDLREMVCGAHLLASDEPLLLCRLLDVFHHTKQQEVEVTVVVEQLLEVLSLPVWQRRSELYSVWVGTQLMGGFGERAHIHVLNGKLVFSFSGSHLATIKLAEQESVHIWCELRSKATRLIGKGRKGAIQPDYVVLREPITAPDAAALVVECKQYLHQSSRKFAAALVDYANGHTAALVLLVNYGSVTSSILERASQAAPALMPRLRVVGQFRPGDANALSEFQRYVNSVFPASPLPAEQEFETDGDESTPVSNRAVREVQLTWCDSGDLDLHCWAMDASGALDHIYFKRPKSILGGARIELNSDVRSGETAEIITITGADSLRLHFAVHAYNRKDIVPASPQVQARIGQQCCVFRPATDHAGPWWNLFEIEPAGGALRISNHVCIDQPKTSQYPND